MIAAMFIAEERKRMIDFSDRYYKTPTVVVGIKRIPMDASPKSLTDKVLRVQAATVHGDFDRRGLSHLLVLDFHFSILGNQIVQLIILPTQSVMGAG